MHQDEPSPEEGLCTPEGRGSCTSKLHLHDEDVSQLSTHLHTSSSDASPGATRPSSRESPRSRPRAKSSSVRMLEEEGENMQFLYFGHLDQSRVSEDMLVSISCLTAVKNLQETGRFGEAQVCVESVSSGMSYLVNNGHAHAPHHRLFRQVELQKVVSNSKTLREQVMASLLLAELFNKWGASSPGYTIDIMERGSVARCATL